MAGSEEYPPFLNPAFCPEMETNVTQTRMEETTIVEQAAYDSAVQLASQAYHGQVKVHGWTKSGPIKKTGKSELTGRVKPVNAVKDALRASPVLLALVNPWLPREVQERTRSAQQLTDHAELPLVCECPQKAPAERKAAEFRSAASFLGEDEGCNPPRPSVARRYSPEAPLPLLPCCFLSGSAVLAAQSLHVQPGDRVLDICAGPGTKSLALACALFAPATPTTGLLEMVGAEMAGGAGGAAAERGRLVCNEPDRGRAALMEGVLTSFLPGGLLKKNGGIVVTTAEAGKGANRVPPVLRAQGPFDKILVDPPCTSARGKVADGVVKPDGDPVAMEEILRCAAALVSPGGLIVYTTGSLEDRENDGLIRKFLRYAGSDFVAEQSPEGALSGLERTEHGALMLPGRTAGHGPLYLAKLRRTQG